MYLIVHIFRRTDVYIVLIGRMQILNNVSIQQNVENELLEERESSCDANNTRSIENLFRNSIG